MRTERDHIEPAIKSLHYSDETANFARMLDLVNVEIIARFTIDGDPKSKSRPRFTKQHGKVRTYTPKATVEAEERIAWLFRQARPNHAVDSTHSYGLACVFFSQTFQRRDVDNMLKLVSDGLNGVAWDDDSQVYEVTGRRGLDDPANARTEVLIYRMGKLWNPTKDCEWCGGPFKVYRSTARSGQRFCSRDCSNASRRKRRMNTCPNCGKEYEGHSGNRKGVYCSMACTSEANRVELDCLVCAEKFTQVRSWVSSNVQVCSRECLVEYRRQRPPKNPKGKCIHCGGATSRKEYTRCAACRTEQRANKRDLRKKVAQ